MHISIWQEFSSNHSADFTVVGVFESAEQANQAVTELTHIAQTVLEWYDMPENAESHEALERGEVISPSPPEIRIAAHYGIEWDAPTPDWLWNADLWTFEHLLFLNGVHCDFGCQPADKIIEKMGGRSFVEGDVTRDEVYSEIYVTLVCVAPDEAAAQRIYDEITGYFEGVIWRYKRVMAIGNGRFPNITEGLPAVIQHLRNAGCRDIHYRLAERREGEIDVP